MPSWVGGVIGTFTLSLILAYGFLRLRCRRVGHPLGPRARLWAWLIMVATAALSTGVGLLIVAASRQDPAAYAGIIVPSGLWLSKLPPEHDGPPVPRPMSFLFGRLYDRMGDDMQDWCDTRLKAASAKPQWIADAAKYYFDQVKDGLKDDKARADLDRWRESIAHKIGVVRQIDEDPGSSRLRATLQMHPATAPIRKYPDDDLPRLAGRLETEALNELHLFLAYVYRLGYHKLLIYPFRPSAYRSPEPSPREVKPAGKQGK
jgi:hypothetical protein